MNELISKEIKAIKSNIARSAIYFVVVLIAGLALSNQLLMAIAILATSMLVMDVLKSDSEDTKIKNSKDGKYFVVKFFTNIIITFVAAFIIYRMLHFAGRMGSDIFTTQSFETTVIYFSLAMVISGIVFFLVFNLSSNSAKMAGYVLIGVVVCLVIVVVLGSNAPGDKTTISQLVEENLTRDINLCFIIAAVAVAINLFLYIISFPISKNKNAK